MSADAAGNFDASMLPALRSVLDFALSSPLSSFYRDKYGAGAPALDGLEELRRLPFLERSELLRTPWRRRLFAPESELADFGISSGTSASGRPLIVPRLDSFQEDMLRYSAPRELLERLGVRRLMTLLPPFSGLARKLPGLPLPGVIVLTGDARSVAGSAVVAAEAGVDGLLTTPSGLERLLDAAQEAGCSLAALKWVSLGGESVSKAKHAYLRGRLPGVRFSTRYGASEFGPTRFFRCDALEEDPALFHPVPGSHLFELVRPDGSPCRLEEPGELVHTDLRLPSAFPFLRYKTGDEAALARARCACGAELRLRLTGKLGYDVFRHAGVQLGVELVERALERHRDQVKADFRLHVRETVVDGRPVPRLELRLVPARALPAGSARRDLAERLETQLAQELLLSPSRTLAELTRLGVFAPLVVELVDGFPAEPGKPRRIVSHL